MKKCGSFQIPGGVIEQFGFFAYYQKITTTYATGLLKCESNTTVIHKTIRTNADLNHVHTSTYRIKYVSNMVYPFKIGQTNQKIVPVLFYFKTQKLCL